MQIQKKEGNIFFIPLFFLSDFKDNVKSYARYSFPKTGTYAFGRLIEIDSSAGDLIEIFNYIGNIPDTKEIIIQSGKMFDPIHVSLAFSKKRWQFVFEDKTYDKNIDSDFQHITFRLGIPEAPKLWRGGVITKIDDNEANNCNEWIVYPPTKVEKMIKELKQINL